MPKCPPFCSPSQAVAPAGPMGLPPATETCRNQHLEQHTVSERFRPRQLLVHRQRRCCPPAMRKIHLLLLQQHLLKGVQPAGGGDSHSAPVFLNPERTQNVKAMSSQTALKATVQLVAQLGPSHLNSHDYRGRLYNSTPLSLAALIAERYIQRLA